MGHREDDCCLTVACMLLLVQLASCWFGGVCDVCASEGTGEDTGRVTRGNCER